MGLEVYNILVQWKKETNTINMTIKIDYTEVGKKILKIYSDHPGPLIGKAGKIISNIKKCLKNMDLIKLK